FTVPEARQIPEVLTTAIRTALSGRPGPVFVEIPVDLLMTTIEDRLAPIPTAYVHRPRGAADPAALETLGRLLAGAERPVVVAGGGIWWDDAAAALTAFATRAGLPVFMNGAGRGALPTSHANAFAQARSTALARADLVLVLGAPLDFRLGYGRPPTSRSRITGSPPRSRAWSHPRRSWSATAATWSVARRRSSRSTGRGSGSIPARSAVSASVPPSRSPPSSCTPSAP